MDEFLQQKGIESKHWVKIKYNSVLIYIISRRSLRYYAVSIVCDMLSACNWAKKDRNLALNEKTPQMKGYKAVKINSLCPTTQELCYCHFMFLEVSSDF